MLHKNVTARIINSLGKYIPLRKRYLFTKSGSLRLRYVATPLMAISTISLMAMSPVSHIQKNNFEIAYSEEVIKIEPNIVISEIIKVAVKEVISQKIISEEKNIELLANIEPVAGSVLSIIEEDVNVKEPAHVQAARYIAKALDRHRDVNGDIRRSSNPEIILASAMTGSVIEKQTEKNVKIGRGDTVAGVLTRSGIKSGDAYGAVKAMGKFLNPRHVKPGQIINLSFDGNSNNFTNMTISLDKISTITVDKNNDGSFSSRLDKKKLEKKVFAKKTVIKNSLYGSAANSGIPSAVIANSIRIFSWNVDFQRDLRSGDSLEVMYDQMLTEDGVVAKNGNIIYAKLTISGREHPIYRYKTSDGKVDYYDGSGQSIKKALMKTPVDGGRISSNYGMRKHPVLGYNKLHKGMDFAAPRGTKIYAAGDGVIERASRNGGYGNYIKIRHNSRLKTAYAHLNKYAKGIKSGKRVKQGQLIGYVGTTGRSTGPHLHYEILVNNKQVNPRRVDLPMGDMLKGKELQKFVSLRKDLDLEYAAKSGTLKYVQIDGEIPPLTR